MARGGQVTTTTGIWPDSQLSTAHDLGRRGSDAKQHHATVLQLEYRDGRVTTSKLPDLPVPLANHVGALVGQNHLRCWWHHGTNCDGDFGQSVCA